MRKEQVQWYLIPALMVLCVVLVLIFIIGLGKQDPQSNADFTDVETAVTQTLDLSNMQPADHQMIKRLYGLNPSDYAGCVLYYPTTNMGAEELLLVKLATMDQQDTVNQAVQQRLQTQKASFEGYGVEQSHLLENSVLQVQGNYILFVVHADAATVQQQFLKAL